MHPSAFCGPAAERQRDRTRQLIALVRYYRKRHEVLERSEGGPYRLTALGAWAASRAPHLFYFFRTIGLSRYRCFLDLGSGDGIVACTAGLFTRSLGIEIDPVLCRIARKASHDLGLSPRVDFIRADYRTQKLWKADCIYHYPDKPLYPLENLLTGWRGTLLIYGPHLPPKRFQPVHELRCGRERMVLYRLPSPLHGEQ